MAFGFGEKRKKSSGSGVALHSPSAIRMLKTRPPAESEPLNPAEFLKTDKRILRRVFIAGTLVAIMFVSVVLAGTSTGIVSGPNLVNPTPSQTTALTTHGFLELTVSADGWDAEGSTPAILRVRPDKSEEYLVCRAVPAGVRDAIELDEGTYYLSWITPVDADGTLYIPPEGEEQVTVRAGHTVSRTAIFTRVPVVDSTFGDYAATIDIVYEAMTHGDETLSGEAGEALMHKLQVNANAAPNFFIYIAEEDQTY